MIPVVDVPLDVGGGLNLPTLGFVLLITVITALLSGTVPALLTAPSDVNEETWVTVSPEVAARTAAPTWTNRVGLVLAIAWPVQCGVGMAVLG